MPQTVEVRFKGTRKAYFHWADTDEPLRLNEAVVVQAERGTDFGRVSATGEAAEKKCAGACNGCAAGDASPEPVRTVVRRATQADIKAANDLRRAEDDARKAIAEKVRAARLDMKVSDSEWQFDRSRLVVFFTAEGRVDFRQLVRELAQQFKTRIELKQIGVRDEAARLGGVGRCGREYCCSTWLGELSPVSLALAKDQRLSLNPSTISGGCGRLLCCLKYEHEFYAQSRKRFPKEGKAIRTLHGTERVIAVDIFRERVFLRGEEGHRTIPLVQFDEERAAAALLPADAPVATATPRPPAREERPRAPRTGQEPARDERPRPERPRLDQPRAEQPRPEQPPRQRGPRPEPRPPQQQRRPAAEPAKGSAPATPPAPRTDAAPGSPAEGASPAKKRRRRRGRGRRPEGGAGTPPGAAT